MKARRRIATAAVLSVAALSAVVSTRGDDGRERVRIHDGTVVDASISRGPVDPPDVRGSGHADVAEAAASTSTTDLPRAAPSSFDKPTPVAFGRGAFEPMPPPQSPRPAADRPATPDPATPDREPPRPDPYPADPAPPEPPRPPGPPGPSAPPTPDPAPALDEVGCPELARPAIGTSNPADPNATILAAARERIRSIVPAIQAAADRDHGGLLVCGREPLGTWRDNLFVQAIDVGPEPFGVVVSGRSVGDQPFWLTDDEWESWNWHPAGSDGSVDFTGVPLLRTTAGGVPVIRTTLGAVVLGHPGAPGVSVVGGAWAHWLSTGGAAGPMGLPTTWPTGHGVDAHQGFERGVLRLPGVTNPFEAIAAPPSAYRWASFVNHPPTRVPTPNSIVKFGDVASFYVDRDGVRHWLRTGSDWMCAVHDLGAPAEPAPFDVVSFAAIPVGPTFVCPSRAR